MNKFHNNSLQDVHANPSNSLWDVHAYPNNSLKYVHVYLTKEAYLNMDIFNNNNINNVNSLYDCHW